MECTKENSVKLSLPVKKKREYGIDALRIVSMFFVVILHMIGNGGIIAFSQPLCGYYIASWFLGCATQCAVNCYGMISGYVGLNAKFKYTNIVMLWLQVTFYTVGITILFWCINPELIEFAAIRSAIFPVYFKQYWYFSAYFALFFFMPALNFLVKKLPKKQLKALLIGLILIFSVFATVFEGDYFYLVDGYSTLWLGTLYLIGAYIKKYDFANKFSIFGWLGIYVVCVLVSLFVKLGIEKYQIKLISGFVNGQILVRYLSPTILMSGVALMGAFAKMKPCRFLCKIIKFVSPLTFGIYLIHVQPYMWNIFTDKLVYLLDLSVYVMTIRVIGVSVIVFVGCMIIEYLRALLFSALGIKKLLLRLEDKFIGDLWTDSEEEQI